MVQNVTARGSGNRRGNRGRNRAQQRAIDRPRKSSDDRRFRPFFTFSIAAGDNDGGGVSEAVVTAS